MTRRGQDVLLGGGVGLLLGLLPGLLAAGAVMTWRLGGDLREIDLVTWFRLLPAAARWQGLPLTAAMIGAGVMGAFALAGIARGVLRQFLTEAPVFSLSVAAGAGAIGFAPRSAPPGST